MDNEELYQKLLAEMGAEALLEDLTKAMSYDQLKENLEFIARMHDIDCE